MDKRLKSLKAQDLVTLNSYALQIAAAYHKGNCKPLLTVLSLYIHEFSFC